MSAFSVLVLSPRFFKRAQVRKALAVSFTIGAGGLLLLVIAGSAPVYLIGFLVTALVLAAMVPATNALIAANVTRSRRGTAFGIASSAQAVALLVGPSAAAVFAAVSLSLGFALLAAVMALLAGAVFLLLREPSGTSSG